MRRHKLLCGGCPGTGCVRILLRLSPAVHSHQCQLRLMGTSFLWIPISVSLLFLSSPRQFTEVVQNRYLPAQDKTKRHLLLADFFRGTWSWGMKKSLKLPLLGKSLNADRKVRHLSKHSWYLQALDQEAWALTLHGREWDQRALGIRADCFCVAFVLSTPLCPSLVTPLDRELACINLPAGSAVTSCNIAAGSISLRQWPGRARCHTRS